MKYRDPDFRSSAEDAGYRGAPLGKTFFSAMLSLLFSYGILNLDVYHENSREGENSGLHSNKG